MHCASAWSAIHSLCRANVRSPTDAGLRSGQSRGCTRAERERQSRLQKRAGQVAGEDREVEEAQARTRGEVGLSGVLQKAQASPETCRS